MPGSSPNSVLFTIKEWLQKISSMWGVDSSYVGGGILQGQVDGYLVTRAPVTGGRTRWLSGKFALVAWWTKQQMMAKVVAWKQVLKNMLSWITTSVCHASSEACKQVLTSLLAVVTAAKPVPPLAWGQGATWETMAQPVQWQSTVY